MNDPSETQVPAPVVWLTGFGHCAGGVGDRVGRVRRGAGHGRVAGEHFIGTGLRDEQVVAERVRAGTRGIRLVVESLLTRGGTRRGPGSDRGHVLHVGVVDERDLAAHRNAVVGTGLQFAVGEVRPRHRPRHRTPGRRQRPHRLLTQRVVVVGGGDVPGVGGGAGPAVVEVGVAGVVADALPVRRWRGQCLDSAEFVVGGAGDVGGVVAGVGRVEGGALFGGPVQFVVHGGGGEVAGRRGGHASWGFDGERVPGLVVGVPGGVEHRVATGRGERHPHFRRLSAGVEDRGGGVAFGVGGRHRVAVAVVGDVGGVALGVGGVGDPVVDVVGERGGDVGQVRGGVLPRVDLGGHVADAVVGIGATPAGRVGGLGELVDLVVDVAGGEVVRVAGAQRAVGFDHRREVADLVVAERRGTHRRGRRVTGHGLRRHLVRAVVDGGGDRAVRRGGGGDVVVGVVDRGRRGDEQSGGLVLGGHRLARSPEQVVSLCGHLAERVGHRADVAARVVGERGGAGQRVGDGFRVPVGVVVAVGGGVLVRVAGGE